MDSVSAEIEFFVATTGAPASVAHRKLAQHRGNLNDAINAYILEQESKKSKEDSKMDTGGASSSYQIQDPMDYQQEADDDEFARAIKMSLEDPYHLAPVRRTAEIEKTLKSIRIDEKPELAKNSQAITVIVRMPDSHHIVSSFRKTDKIRDLFHFVNVVGFKSDDVGLYTLAPRFAHRAYTAGDIFSTFEEVGLCNDVTLYVQMLS